MAALPRPCSRAHPAGRAWRRRSTWQQPCSSSGSGSASTSSSASSSRRSRHGNGGWCCSTAAVVCFFRLGTSAVMRAPRGAAGRGGGGRVCGAERIVLPCGTHALMQRAYGGGWEQATFLHCGGQPCCAACCARRTPTRTTGSRGGLLALCPHNQRLVIIICQPTTSTLLALNSADTPSRWRSRSSRYAAVSGTP